MLIHSNCQWPSAQKQSFRGQYNREYVFFYKCWQTHWQQLFWNNFPSPIIPLELDCIKKSYSKLKTSIICNFFKHKKRAYIFHVFVENFPSTCIPFFMDHTYIYYSRFHWKLTSTCFPSLDRAYLFSDRERSPPGQNCIAAVVFVCWGIVGKSQSQKNQMLA